MAIARWLEFSAFDLEWFHVPNGGKRSKAQAGIFKAMGVKAGVPDLVFWGMPACPLAFVELKIGDGRLSTSQIDFQATARLRGVPYHVIKTDDPLIAVAMLRELLVSWGAATPKKA